MSLSVERSVGAKVSSDLQLSESCEMTRSDDEPETSGRRPVFNRLTARRTGIDVVVRGEAISLIGARPTPQPA